MFLMAEHSCRPGQKMQSLIVICASVITHLMQQSVAANTRKQSERGRKEGKRRKTKKTSSQFSSELARWSTLGVISREVKLTAIDRPGGLWLLFTPNHPWPLIKSDPGTNHWWTVLLDYRAARIWAVLKFLDSASLTKTQKYVYIQL